MASTKIVTDRSPLPWQPKFGILRMRLIVIGCHMAHSSISFVPFVHKVDKILSCRLKFKNIDYSLP